MTATSTAQTQTTAAFDALSNYYNDVASYVASGSGTAPDIANYFSGIEYSSLYNIAAITQKSSPNYITGYVIETIHHICAIQRETEMGTLSKTSHYQNGASEINTESDYYDSLSSQYGYTVTGIGVINDNGGF